MPKVRSKAKATLAPWWLSSGDHECPHCGQLYIYELEFRCPDCDGPCCIHCKAKHAEGHHVCPECVTSGAEAASQASRNHGS
jgi:hypothetical protein